MRVAVFSILFFLTLPLVALAQDEDDGGFLTRTIENALSGAGREVKLTGFKGALSSEASFERMTIADAEGVWLTLEDARLIWSRTALLRGRLQVNELRAASLDLPRLPVPEEEEFSPPPAEAGGFEFALPELPVSINIESFEIDRITLGEPLIGVPVDLEVKAAARLDDDGLNLDVAANRIDDVQGAFSILTRVERDTSLITLDIGLDEADGGIAARLLQLPGQPSVKFDIEGQGPLNDFKTQINLSTDGSPRMVGDVSVLALNTTAEVQRPDRQIKADLGGDITALIVPEYRDFFGQDVQLGMTTLLAGDGSIDVQEFEISARALDLNGAVRLNSDMWPEYIGVSGELEQGGQPVLLPGSDVTVNSVVLDVAFDAAQGDALTGVFDISDLTHQAVQVASLQLGVEGTLDGGVSEIGQLLVDVTLDAVGVLLDDADVGSAVGSRLTGGAQIKYADEQPVQITGLNLRGADYSLDGNAVIEGLDDGFPTRLDVRVQAEDFSRFAPLANRDLSGSARLEVDGTITPLAGTFDLSVKAEAEDVTVGIAQADALLAGETQFSVQTSRNETGTFVRDLVLNNSALDVFADAAIRSAGSDIDARITLADVGLVAPQYEGALDVSAKALQEGTDWRVDASAIAPYDSRLKINGLLTGPDADVVFELSIPETKAYVPQLQGPLQASGRVFEIGNGYAVDMEASGPYQGELDVAGVATGPDAALEFTTSVPNVAVLFPNFSGPLNIEGDLTRQGERYAIDTSLTGPAGTTSAIAGSFLPDASDVDISVKGAAPLGLSGPFLSPRSLVGQLNFDLGVRGTPSIEAVAGQVTTTDARFTDPNLRLGLENIGTTVDLSQGVANIDLGADVIAGGRANVTGSLNLASLVADIAVQLRRAVLVDPRIYSATLDADITAQGPLTGGASVSGNVNLDEVNITVPGSGVTSVGTIPIIRHVGAGSDVLATRRKAGLRDEEEIAQEAASGPSFPLDIIIEAPRQIFVRGRGLNAELGGEITVKGTSGAPISAGSFDLIRGRLDVIGKRFNLDEGIIQFQGSSTPFIRFISTTEIPDGTATITIEGLATEPEISFTSSPEAPEDEVLSLIIFGRYVSELSAFQALQLANGLAQVTGNGGINIIGNLRAGVGLDELDVATTESGETQVSAGKYITDNIYTDVRTSATEGTDVSVNVDLTKDLTGRATVGGEGESSIGLFFQRDY